MMRRAQTFRQLIGLAICGGGLIVLLGELLTLAFR
jgi:hypothetical protein